MLDRADIVRDVRFPRLSGPEVRIGCTTMPGPSGLLSTRLVCVYPTIAVVAAKGTYWSKATSVNHV